MPPSFQQRVLAILATGRFANLPTVWSNILVGALLPGTLMVIFGDGPALVAEDSAALALIATLAFFSGSALYVGGCILGDAFDAAWDAEHRPDRPIPSGVLSGPGMTIAGYLLIGVGWLGASLNKLILFLVSILFEYGPGAVLSSIQSIIADDMLSYAISFQQVVLGSFLALTIFLYAKLHKRIGTGAPILMSMCRGLLVLWAGSLATSGNHFLLDLSTPLGGLLSYAFAIVIYTIVLSLVARKESDPNLQLPPRFLRVLYVTPPVGLAIYGLLSPYSHVGGVFPWLVVSGAFAAFLTWTSRSLIILRRSVPAFVSNALAGFCLVDALFAIFIGWQVVLLCFAFFLLALLLQRIAPAT